MTSSANTVSDSERILHHLAEAVKHLSEHWISASNTGIAEPIEAEVIQAVEGIAGLLYQSWPRSMRLAGSSTYYPEGDSLMMVTDWGVYDLTRARETNMPADVAVMFLADLSDLLDALSA